MSDETIGPTLPPGWTSDKLDDDSDDSGLYGPSLPSTAANKSDEDERVIGPTLPPHLRERTQSETVESVGQSCDVIGPSLPSTAVRAADCDDSDGDSSDDDMVGPLPETHHLYDKVNEKFGDCSQVLSRKDSRNDKLEREEWMTIAPTKLKPMIPTKSVKHFSQRSSKIDHKESKAKYKRDDKREEELSELMDSYNKSHKRDVSLVDIHSQKSKKNKSEPKAEERVPFDPDKDLAVRRLNPRQTQSVLNKAKTFNDRFSNSRVNKFL